jgi:hypothetical protein
MDFLSFLPCHVLLFLFHRAHLSNAAWCATSICWSDVHVVDIAKVELELSCQSFQFFSLVPLVLFYSSCASFQVVEAAQNLYVFLLVASFPPLVGLVLFSSHLTYQNFCAPCFLHRFVVEGFPGMCVHWVPYPINFFNEFRPGFSLALGVDFLLPSIDNCLSFCIDLLKKGTFGLSGRLFHPSDILGTCWEFLPLGPTLTLCILHSQHLYLNAVASVMTSSSTSILPFLVPVITTRWSMAIPDASYFMGFPRR